MPGQQEELPSLRETLNTTFAAADTAAPAPEPASSTPSAPVAADTGEPSSSSPAATSAPTPDAPAKPAEAAPADTSAPKAAPGDGSNIDKMPPGFTGGEAAWKALPVDTRAWMKGRERQFAQGIEQNRIAAEVGKQMRAEIGPYLPMLRAAGVAPNQVVREALQAHHAMTMGTQAQKVYALQRMAQNYGVPIGAVMQQQDQGVDTGDGQSSGDPRVDQLYEVVQALAMHTQTAEGRRAQQEYQQYRQAASMTVDQFAKSGNAKYLNHPGVLETMARLVETGGASSLPHAYKMALQTKPELEAAMYEEIAQQRAKDAAAARFGAPASGGAPVSVNTTPSNQTIRGLLESQIAA